jgi:hypothetical protein
MRNKGGRANRQYKSVVMRSILLGSAAAALLAAAVTTSAAQQLPPGGGQVPPVRRGADGQIEVVVPKADPHAGASRDGAAPQASAPKGGSQAPRPDGAARVVPNAVTYPPQPVITVMPSTPSVPDTTRLGAVVATYSVKMSDGSPFTGSVGFGPPYYDGKGAFALSGNSIIVNPKGPGLGRNKTTITAHITLTATP